jgi:hypothetical protein
MVADMWISETGRPPVQSLPTGQGPYLSRGVCHSMRLGDAGRLPVPDPVPVGKPLRERNIRRKGSVLLRGNFTGIVRVVFFAAQPLNTRQLRGGDLGDGN